MVTNRSLITESELAFHAERLLERKSHLCGQVSFRPQAAKQGRSNPSLSALTKNSKHNFLKSSVDIGRLGTLTDPYATTVPRHLSQLQPVFSSSRLAPLPNMVMPIVVLCSPISLPLASASILATLVPCVASRPAHARNWPATFQSLSCGLSSGTV